VKKSYLVVKCLRVASPSIIKTKDELQESSNTLPFCVEVNKSDGREAVKKKIINKCIKHSGLDLGESQDVDIFFPDNYNLFLEKGESIHDKLDRIPDDWLKQADNLPSSQDLGKEQTFRYTISCLVQITNKKSLENNSGFGNQSGISQAPDLMTSGHDKTPSEESEHDAVLFVLGAAGFVAGGLACEFHKSAGDLSNGFASSIHSSSFDWQVIGGVLFLVGVALGILAGCFTDRYATNQDVQTPNYSILYDNNND
jgi:hypothetical protein